MHPTRIALLAAMLTLAGCSKSEYDTCLNVEESQLRDAYKSTGLMLASSEYQEAVSKHGTSYIEDEAALNFKWGGIYIPDNDEWEAEYEAFEAAHPEVTGPLNKLMVVLENTVPEGEGFELEEIDMPSEGASLAEWEAYGSTALNSYSTRLNVFVLRMNAMLVGYDLSEIPGLAQEVCNARGLYK